MDTNDTPLKALDSLLNDCPEARRGATVRALLGEVGYTDPRADRVRLVLASVPGMHAQLNRPMEYLTGPELRHVLKLMGATRDDGASTRSPGPGDLTGEESLALRAKLQAVDAGNVQLTLAPPGVMDAAKALRAAQKAYMQDRGNNDLGREVGKRSAYLDRAIAAAESLADAGDVA